jgi:cytosine deaminase
VLYDPLLLHVRRHGVLYEIPRIVIGENRSFQESEAWLRSHGKELVVADDADCIALMDRMMSERPELWAEDIGVDPRPPLRG